MACGNNSAKETPKAIISIEGGSVSGITDTLRGIRLYAGIPYAAPPIGELRWKEPLPVIPWEGVKKADKFSKICYQPTFEEGSWINKEFYPEGVPEMSEDCLYLNVWTPLHIAKKKKLPVIFWIHGGGLQHGWGHEMEFDGEAFTSKEVILVTINYRVGVFGFLAHPWLDSESLQNASGNYGIHDQIAALKWVKNNISQFGGDPENVTIMGQSAGARSTMAHISSPLSKGLFKQAIIQSGSGAAYKSVNPVQTLQEREVICKEFVHYTKVKTLTELRSLNGQQLLDYYIAFNTEKEQKGDKNLLRFTPNIDGYLLPADHDELLETGRQSLPPVIIGYTSEDTSPEAMRDSATEWSLIREKQNQPKTYIYLFKRQLPGDNRGAFHSSELWYVFGTLDRCWRPFTHADYKLSYEILAYWTNFAKTGDPNGDDTIIWDSYSQKNRFIKEFDITK